MNLITEKLNQNTVTVVSGNPNGTYLYLAYDMSAVLDDGNELRVLPVIGKGGYQNVMDVLHLRGVDLGITQANIMSYLKKTGEFGPNIDARLAYVARLYNEEMHVLAGPGITRIQDLSGKKVNFSDVGSGTQFSTRLIFELLGIKAEEVNMGQGDGYQKVKSGEIAATVLIAGKPTGAFGKFKLEPGMTLLPVPYTEALEQDYLPTKLTNDDYPNLIPKGSTLDTIAIPSVLAVYNWPRDTDRYRRVASSSTPSSPSSRSSSSRPVTSNGRKPISRRPCAAGGGSRRRRSGSSECQASRGRRRPRRHRSGGRARPGGQGRAQRRGRAGAPVSSVHGLGEDAKDARLRAAARQGGRRGGRQPGTAHRGEGRAVTGRRQAKARAAGTACRRLAAACARRHDRRRPRRYARPVASPGADKPRPTIAVAATIPAEPGERDGDLRSDRPSRCGAPQQLPALRGLPPMAALSDGHSIAPGAWAVSLAALPDLKIMLPAGAAGRSEIVITLVTVDGSMLAETKATLVIAAARQLERGQAQRDAGPPRAPRCCGLECRCSPRLRPRPQSRVARRRIRPPRRRTATARSG